MDDKMRGTGRVLVFVPQFEPNRWLTLRSRGGKSQTSNDPYAQEDEVVGGLFNIEAESRENAERLGAMHALPRWVRIEDGGTS